MNLKFVLVSSAVLVLSACASTPEPAPIVDNRPQQEAPPPVFSEPAPVAPVEQAPVLQAPTIYDGPSLGSIEQFQICLG